MATTLPLETIKVPVLPQVVPFVLLGILGAAVAWHFKHKH